MDSSADATFPSSSGNHSTTINTTASTQSQAEPSVGKYDENAEDYLSTDDILALSQRVGCKFEKPVEGLGFIDQSCENNDIPIGNKQEMPLWLAKVMLKMKLINIEVPKGYNTTYREILEADSTVVDLHTLGPHFYKFGKHLVGLNLKESDEIAKSLIGSFHQRFHKLFDFSLSGTADTALEILQYQSTLDNIELDILDAGRRSTSEFKRWENRTSEKVTANEMVATHKKRKRAARQHGQEDDDTTAASTTTQSSSYAAGDDSSTQAQKRAAVGGQERPS